MTKLWATLFLLAASGAASAQDGGKLRWRGKNEDPKTAIADAKAKGRPLLLFFTSKGCKYCHLISDGAFSDPEVVAASSALVCIFIDCDWGKKNEELADHYQVTGYPTVALCDPNGKVINRLNDREPPAVLKAFQEIARKYPGGADAAGPIAKPTFLEYSATALAAAKQASQPLLVFFYDDSQATDTVNRALGDPLLREMRGRFVLAQAPYVKGSDLCVRCDVSRAPTLLLLDPAKEKPEAQPRGRIAGSRGPRELLRDLQDLLDGGRAPSSGPATAGPAPARGAKEEVLSDDEVDRKFIQARLSLAIDANKRGKKAKAIEILEDLLLSYPRHVLTKDVKTLLDDVKK